MADVTPEPQAAPLKHNPAAAFRHRDYVDIHRSREPLGRPDPGFDAVSRDLHVGLLASASVRKTSRLRFHGRFCRCSCRLLLLLDGRQAAAELAFVHQIAEHVEDHPYAKQ